ncbi:hypothetical protein ACLB2K_065564 [Fragaria x ananassa]
MGLACMRDARLSSSRNPLYGSISRRLEGISPRLVAISPRLDFLFFKKSPARSNLASPRRNLASPGSRLTRFAWKPSRSLESHLASPGLSLLRQCPLRRAISPRLKGILPCLEAVSLAWNFLFFAKTSHLCFRASALTRSHLAPL